jgi:hypothetical protein
VHGDVLEVNWEDVVSKKRTNDIIGNLLVIRNIEIISKKSNCSLSVKDGVLDHVSDAFKSG